MYCPSCGTQASTDQRFCRSCGFSLHTVSQVLTGQLPTAEPDRSLMEIVQRLQSRRNRWLRWGFITFWGGIVTSAFFGIVGNALQAFNWRVGGAIEDFAGIGGLILLVGIGFMIYSRFMPKAPVPQQSTRPAARSQATPPQPLPSHRRPDSVSSVTEHTTELLQRSENQPIEAPPQALRESNE